MRKKEPFEFYLAKHYTKQTVRSYVFTVNNFLKIYPNAEKLQHKDIIYYIAKLSTTMPNVVTRNTMLCALKKYYDYLITIKKRQDHPCRSLRIKGENIARRSQVHFQQLFSIAELQLLLNRENRYNHLLVRNKLIISFLIYQGLTCEEITLLNLNNINIERSRIKIRATRRLKSRVLDLRPEQITWFTEFTKLHRGKLNKTQTTRLFLSIRGVPETVESIGGMLEPLKALFPDRSLNAKTIRMSVISNWVNVYQFSIEKTQYLAGHKWPSSTLRYKRIDLNLQRDKLNKWHPIFN